MRLTTPLILAALLISAGLASAVQAEPRAVVRGDMDGDLRERIERAVGEVDTPPESRFQARRRARAAVENAIAVLRSEGYYQAVVEDDVEGEDQPLAVVLVTPGPRFVLAEPQGEWRETAPDPETAAAAIEACIDAIEQEDLLANVRRVSQYIRDTCIVGPITGHQGAGFLTGLISRVPAGQLQKALMEQNILTGTSGDPNVLRLLPPFTLKEAEVDLLAAALKRLG